MLSVTVMVLEVPHLAVVIALVPLNAVPLIFLLVSNLLALAAIPVTSNLSSNAAVVAPLVNRLVLFLFKTVSIVNASCLAFQLDLSFAVT